MAWEQHHEGVLSLGAWWAWQAQPAVLVESLPLGGWKQPPITSGVGTPVSLGLPRVRSLLEVVEVSLGLHHHGCRASGEPSRGTHRKQPRAEAQAESYSWNKPLEELFSPLLLPLFWEPRGCSSQSSFTCCLYKAQHVDVHLGVGLRAHRALPWEASPCGMASSSLMR